MKYLLFFVTVVVGVASPTPTPSPGHQTGHRISSGKYIDIPWRTKVDKPKVAPSPTPKPYSPY